MSKSFAIPWNVAHQTPLSMQFCRQEYWSGLHFLLQGNLLSQGSNSHLLHWQVGSLQQSHQGSPRKCSVVNKTLNEAGDWRRRQKRKQTNKCIITNSIFKINEWEAVGLFILIYRSFIFLDLTFIYLFIYLFLKF